MKNILIIATPFLVGLFLLTFIREIATYQVYGGFISDERLDTYFPKHLERYYLNGLDKDQTLMHTSSLSEPYLSKHPSVFSSWHVNDIGVIPRWSKWSKVFDEKLEKERAENPKKPLF